MALLPSTLAIDLACIGLRPKDVVLYANGHCNLRCRHCYVGNEMLASKVEFGAQSIVAAVAGFGTLFRLTLLGGEIFRHSAANTIFREIDTSSIAVPRVTTNLTIWNEAAIDAALERKFRFCVSVDGAREETHDRIRGRGTFALTMRHLQRLRTVTANVEVIHTVNRWNRDQLGELVELCRSMNIPSLNIHLVTPQGNALLNDDNFTLTASEWRETLRLVFDDGNLSGTPPVAVRYPLRFATHQEYAQLLVNGYHHHAVGSYHANNGNRVVIYASGEIFVSSEAFGTDALIGRICGETFVPNKSRRSELRLAREDEFDISSINTRIHGDANFPVALSVSFKQTALC